MPLTFGEHFQFASYFTIITKNAVIKQKIFYFSFVSVFVFGTVRYWLVGSLG